MNCSTVSFSGHALRRMFNRKIREEEVKQIIKVGELIKSYEHDKPYPSYLILGYVNQRPIHLVIAANKEDGLCIVVTVYEPDENIWQKNFKEKR